MNEQIITLVIIYCKRVYILVIIGRFMTLSEIKGIVSNIKEQSEILRGYL